MSNSSLNTDRYACKLGKTQAWILATRPKTLTASLVPVLVGTLLARDAVTQIDWGIALFALLAAFCIQIATNFTNDALDFKKGADTEKRLGPMRVTQSGLLPMQQVLWVGFAAFGAALLFGIPLMIQGGWPIVLLLVISVLFSYLYTGGPYPLAYYGLGDLFVLLFYGLASTTAVYYLQTGTVEMIALLAGLQIGMLATVMIAINNLRDIEGDASVNKRTLAVRLGQKYAKWEITALIILPFLLNIGWLWMGYELAALLPLLTLPLAVKLTRSVLQTAPSRLYNTFLAWAALLHLAFGLLLAISV